MEKFFFALGNGGTPLPPPPPFSMTLKKGMREKTGRNNRTKFKNEGQGDVHEKMEA